MQRWHQDIQVMKRQKKIWDHSWFYKEKSLGRFRKKHAFDCGKSGCLLCHSDKQLKYRRRKEEEVDLKFKEGLEEK